MALNEFQRAAYKVMGGTVIRSMNLTKLEDDLRKARLGVRAEAYVSHGLLLAIITGLFGLVMGLGLWFVVLPLAFPGAPPFLAVVVLIVPLLMGGTTYAVMVGTPSGKAKQRAKDIDMRLPYALNYIAAMASAGVNMDVVFKSLAEQKIYGEVAKESEWIYRDMAYFGRDAVTAMKRAIRRTPSDKFAEFLQGAITTLTSGGDLQHYFTSKAQRYMWENRQDQKQFVDMMGLMAETYVTACVAGPLFLIVMMAIMGMIGGQGPAQLYLVIYLLLPVANAGFAFALKNMTPEV
ncbi:MAG TPA: type II secretion system F family protein [Candidatus Thermoplasmatota archaeon]|nr:type II secretion system F family protein [Candidatus Thermoplasmatota archaeon]